MEIKKDYIIPRNDMCMSDAMPFSQHWEVRVPVPIEELNFNTALQACYAVLKSGDLINVCSFERNGGDWKRLREVVSLRVVAVENRKIETCLVSEIVKIKENKDDPAHVSNAPLEIVKVGNAYEVRDGGGHTLEAFVDEGQAKAFRDRHGPKAMAQAVEVDRSKWTITRGFQGRSIVRNEEGEVIREFRKKEDAEAFVATGKAPEQKAA